MKTLCVYHTRSGYSAAVAKYIAAALDAEVLCITDGKPRKGMFGYIAAAVAGLKKTLPALLPFETARPLCEYDRIVAVAPIWCEDISPVMRAFLTQNGEALHGDFQLVVTHMSDISYEAKAKTLCERIGKPDAPFLSLQTHRHDWKPEADAFLREQG